MKTKFRVACLMDSPVLGVLQWLADEQCCPPPPPLEGGIDYVAVENPSTSNPTGDLNLILCCILTPPS